MNICLSIPFQSPESATLAFDVLNVDKEFKGSGVSRILSINGKHLEINFHGAELKRLRVAVNAFIKNVLLVVKTLKQYGEFQT